MVRSRQETAAPPRRKAATAVEPVQVEAPVRRKKSAAVVETPPAPKRTIKKRAAEPEAPPVKAKPLKKAPVAKPVEKKAVKKAEAAPAPKSADKHERHPMTNFIIDSDYDKTYHIAVAGGRDRREILDKMREELNPLTSTGSKKNLSAILGIVTNIMTDMGYVLESSWQMVDPDEE